MHITAIIVMLVAYNNIYYLSHNIQCFYVLFRNYEDHCRVSNHFVASKQTGKPCLGVTAETVTFLI